MNADPRVMEFLAGPLSRERSDALIARIEEHFDRHGYGVWAIEVPGVEPFIGFAGLSVVTFEAPLVPAVEVAWRLARDAWRSGYATEAGRASLDHGFGCLGLESIVSFTAEENIRSRRVMERLGMTHDPRDDFDHPRLPPGHPLRRHVLYRATAQRSP